MNLIAELKRIKEWLLHYWASCSVFCPSVHSTVCWKSVYDTDIFQQPFFTHIQFYPHLSQLVGQHQADKGIPRLQSWGILVVYCPSVQTFCYIHLHSHITKTVRESRISATVQVSRLCPGCHGLWNIQWHLRTYIQMSPDTVGHTYHALSRMSKILRKP